VAEDADMAAGAGPPPGVQVAETIEIRGEMIRLGQLLKLADVVDSGSAVKDLLADTPVNVNGEPENRRGRQLRPGDVVTVAGRTLRLATRR
jgi:ribosome-associated protein